MPRVLLVSTSAPYLGVGKHPTGVWVEEIAAPYYIFEEAGYEVTIASPQGGPIPIDSGSMEGNFLTAESKKFLHDPRAIRQFCHSKPLADVKVEDVDCMFMSGGHGTAADFVGCAPLKKLIESTYNAGRKVASVCHGPICFVDCVKANGEPLVKGHKVTVFSNAEEDAVQQTAIVKEACGFLAEDKFKELGGTYMKGEAMFGEFVVVDGNLITGQNPTSSIAAAKALVRSITPRVLLVATSAAYLGAGKHATGVWVEEIAAPYYIFKEAGYLITIASPAGGPIPVDSGSMAGNFLTEECKKFLLDPDAMQQFCHSKPLAEVKAEDIDIMFMSGGHGTAADFVGCAPLKKLIESTYNAGRKVASVCHGPICFVDCVKANGEPLVKGHKVTVFSNAEEDAVQLTAIVKEACGFLAEDKFKELGGTYMKGEDMFGEFVIVDGNLITGQNPTSSAAAARAVVSA